jgi:hypothetical protein
MRISKATYEASEYACTHFHYSKATPVISDSFNVFNDDDEWCGVIIYGSGANMYIAKPYDKWQGQVLELVRVALNGKQGHGNTSKAVALTLKQMKKSKPWCDLIVSYADLDQNHAGTLYQATNWVYTGVMNKDSMGAFIINGKKTHPKSCYSKGWKQSILWLREHIDPKAEVFVTKGKHKYIYPMTKAMRARVDILAKPYPCGNRSAVEQPSSQMGEGGATPTLPLQP